MSLYELAALGTACCWAMSAMIAADAIGALGAFRFNLIRQGIVTALLFVIVMATGGISGLSFSVGVTLVISGLLGVVIGDTLLFTAVGRLGPRRSGAVFALNAPMAAILGWVLLNEALPLQAWLGIGVAACGVALAILGRSNPDGHRLEQLNGPLWIGVGLAGAAALGQAAGSLIARPVMAAGMDPWLASFVRVGASAATLGTVAALGFAPKPSGPMTGRALILAAAAAILGLLIGMTLLLFALQGGATGIVATLSATSPVIILPLLWLRTGQRPTMLGILGAVLAVVGLGLIFLR